MKRKAEYQLDRDEFERGAYDDDETPKPQANQGLGDNMATPEQIAQRRIVKIKNPLHANQEAAKPKFELSGAFGATPAETPKTDQATGETAPPVSFVNKLFTPGAQTTTAPGTTGGALKGGLFGTLFNKAPAATTEEKKPETTTTEQKPEEKKSLFGGLLGSGGLFSSGGLASSLSTPATGTTAATGEKKGLFAGLFPSNGSLDNLAKKDYSFVHEKTGEKDEDEEEEESGSKKKVVVGAPKQALFASLSNFNPAQLNTTSSLFSGVPKTGGMSSFLSNIKGNDESDGEGDDDGEDVPRTPSPEADITKSKGSYEYKLDYDKIASKKVNKCKPGQKNLLAEGEISINKSKTTGAYTLIYRNKAKLIQYQGHLIAKASKITELNTRCDAISVIAYSTEAPEKPAEGEGETKAAPKLSADVVKLMFASVDDCKEFRAELEKIVN